MKKTVSLFLFLTLLLSVFSFAQAEQALDETWVWFLNGGTPPEAAGSGVVIWDIREGSGAYRQDLVPEANRPADAHDVGYVIVLRQGSDGLVGFYSNGASGLRHSVDLILVDAATGAELGEETAFGGDPPQRTTSTSMQIYGSWPDDSAISESAAELCQSIPEEKPDAQLWRYVVREAGDEQAVRDEYTETSPECLAFLTFEPGIEIQGYDGYVGGNLEIPAEIDGLPVTAVGRRAFVNMTGFDSIHLPETVTRIGELAFANSYTRIYLSDGVTLIPYQAVSDTNIVHIPSGVRAIGEHALSSNWELESLELPEGLERIESFAISNWVPLQSATLPRSLTYVDAAAFMDCPNLILRVYSDSYAYNVLKDGGKLARENYAHEHETDPESLDWLTIPELEVIE